jgi:hypothetical protein
MKLKEVDIEVWEHIQENQIQQTHTQHALLVVYAKYTQKIWIKSNTEQNIQHRNIKNRNWVGVVK